ncbi:serum amyloid P-component-like [Latimeria chalumnae]
MQKLNLKFSEESSSDKPDIMKTLLGLCVFFLLALLATSDQIGLKRKEMIFPEQSKDSYMKLIPKKEDPISNFTLCLKVFSDLSRPQVLFSLATKQVDNEILLLRDSYQKISIFVGGSSVSYEVKTSPHHWMDMCVTWNSETGIVGFWHNGQRLVKKALKKGYTINEKPIIILGQEQDGYGEKFDPDQSFVGEIKNVYMWNRVLSPGEVRSVRYGDYPDPNIIDWESVEYEVAGNVVIEPSETHDNMEHKH